MPKKVKEGFSSETAMRDMFTRKKQVEDYESILMEMASQKVLIKPPLVYWQNHGRLAAAIVTIEDQQYVIDLDMLAYWIYPGNVKNKKITKAEIEEFVKDSIEYCQKK